MQINQLKSQTDGSTCFLTAGRPHQCGSSQHRHCFQTSGDNRGDNIIWKLTNSIMGLSEKSVLLQSVFFKRQLVELNCWLLNSFKAKVQTDVQLSSLMRWKMGYECGDLLLTKHWNRQSLLQGLDKQGRLVWCAPPLLADMRAFERFWEYIVKTDFILLWWYRWEYAILTQHFSACCHLQFPSSRWHSYRRSS